VLEVDTLMVDLDSLVIFDPATSTLYAARDLPMAMNGQSLQLTLPGNSTSTPTVSAPVKRRRSKKQRASDKRSSEAFKKANETGRKKDGSFKKGYDQARIASLAQRLKKKMK
jgi:hypothetical protein